MGRIFSVDDDQRVTSLLQYFLKSEKYDVDIAGKVKRIYPEFLKHLLILFRRISIYSV